MVHKIEIIELKGNDHGKVRDMFNKDMEEKKKDGYRVQQWATFTEYDEIVLKYVAEKMIY